MPQNEGIGFTHTQYFLILTFSDSVYLLLIPVIYDIKPLLQGVSSVRELKDKTEVAFVRN